ncbi:helix-turn-helix domain-containing protein [Pseudomonas monteilii]|jgi:transcriptional regulator with XRE-family HTH domain|uniref:helix-turn-helix domain-containing protein n=1 Tax=Pseudomonadota TaxID=1224 RepID=UPI001E3C8A66|nr:helix-turn-helix transcriptional regulator [Pseudomonas monteilii]MCE0872495.1 helix-turn-helix domain-containing protein [Pseudomonas monteilii]
MQKRTAQQGRPPGTTSHEPKVAIAFGKSVRAARTEREIGQEQLADLAGIDRSHLGKIERGGHMPTLALILRIARALKMKAAELIAATENNLDSDADS